MSTYVYSQALIHGIQLSEMESTESEQTCRCPSLETVATRFKVSNS